MSSKKIMAKMSEMSEMSKTSKKSAMAEKSKSGTNREKKESSLTFGGDIADSEEFLKLCTPIRAATPTP
jgi:hypothetical protein